jgi:structure-specific recognition protein 1
VSAEVRRRRRKKDPRAPKKSLTSYLVFMQRHRAELAAANPGVSTQDLTTLLAEKWKTVEEEERRLCEEIALNDHVR